MASTSPAPIVGAQTAGAQGVSDEAKNRISEPVGTRANNRVECGSDPCIRAGLGADVLEPEAAPLPEPEGYEATMENRAGDGRTAATSGTETNLETHPEVDFNSSLALDSVCASDLADSRKLAGGETINETPNLDSDRPTDRDSSNFGTGDTPGTGSDLAELPAKPGETAEPVLVIPPHVANKPATESAAELPHVAEKTLPKNVLKFATRGKSKQVKPRAKSTTKRATRGKSQKPPKVEDVKASKGTWAFRLRWNSLPGRPVIYVSRVADSTYELIKKGNYEAFKEQLISSYGESALRASNQA